MLVTCRSCGFSANSLTAAIFVTEKKTKKDLEKAIEVARAFLAGGPSDAWRRQG